METLQSLLTIVIEATAVLGFSGIAAHALFTSHRNWQATYCPPIAAFQEEAIAWSTFWKHSTRLLHHLHWLPNIQ